MPSFMEGRERELAAGHLCRLKHHQQRQRQCHQKRWSIKLVSPKPYDHRRRRRCR